MRLSSRLSLIQPSITLGVTSRAAKLTAQGIDVVSFGAGEPDFDTPDHIKEAAKQALDRGYTKYTAVGGSVELRRAICGEMARAHKLTFTPEQVLVSSGAKHALFNIFHALLDAGDEVIIPSPYWVSYPDIVTLAGGTPVIVKTNAADDFQLDPAQLEKAVTPRTRAIVICSPSNPTGAVYSRETLLAVAEIAVRRNLLIVTDDIYRRLVYGVESVEIATLGSEIAARTIIVDGFSKTYSMTGWRLGYTCGPAPLIEAMATLQGQSTSNPTSISQAAAVAALTGPEEPIERMRQEFDRRRLVMIDLLRAIPGVKCTMPRGAFYAFPDVSAHLGKKPPDRDAPIASDAELCDWLLASHRVAVVPGSGFGAPGYVRLSYATSMEAVREGLKRFAAGLAELQ